MVDPGKEFGLVVHFTELVATFIYVCQCVCLCTQLNFILKSFNLF